MKRSSRNIAWAACVSAALAIAPASAYTPNAVSYHSTLTSGHLLVTSGTNGDTVDGGIAGALANLNLSASFGSSGGNLILNPSAASVLGGVESLSCPSHQWFSSLDTSGIHHCTQPAFTDISGILGATQLPAPTASTPGGVESITCPSHQWIDVLATSGAFACTQPAFTDISGIVGASQLPVNALPSIGYQSGRFYTGPILTAAASTLAISTNTIYFMPFYSAGASFTKESVNVTVGGSGNCEMGVWANSSGVPGSLIEDSGNTSVSGTGIIQITGLTLGMSTPGWYWLGFGCNVAATVITNNSSNGLTTVLLGNSGGTTASEAETASWSYSGGSPGSPTLPSNPTIAYAAALTPLVYVEE